MWPRIHLVLRTFLVHRHPTFLWLFFFLSLHTVYIPSCLVPLPLLLLDPAAASVRRWYHIMSCGVELLLNIVFILALILSPVSTAAFLCCIFSSPHDCRWHPAHGEKGQQPSLVSAGGRRSLSACWRYTATSTTVYRFCGLLAQASWMSKHHLVQWLQQVVLSIFKGQWFFSSFCFLPCWRHSDY